MAMITKILNNKNDFNTNDSNTRENIRRTFYKSRIKKDNIRLELDADTPQEERRKLLLEYQKKHREEAFNAARGILQKKYFHEVEDAEESMDTAQCHSRSKNLTKHRKHLMMLSEWMMEVPQDFMENWIMVPCPIGKRNRLVACKGITKAYNKNGKLCDTFHSALPGGNPNSKWHQSTVLDCIWVNSQKIYYVLDVLIWRTQPLTNCEAECRLYSIDSRINETEELKKHDTEGNKYSILSLPRIRCDSDLSATLMTLTPEFLSLDGFLFYHRNAHYNFGYTPLVTWLKPFMLSEVLGLSVPSSFDEKPDNYIDIEHYINRTQQRTQNSKIVIKNYMEIV